MNVSLIPERKFCLTSNYRSQERELLRGEGSWCWDMEGVEYLDLSGGIAVNSLGHANRTLRDVLQRQAETLWHVSNVFRNIPSIDLADNLCRLSFADRVFFCNSGAEANEAALKLARRYAVDKSGVDKDGIIAFKNGFHGRTFFTVCVGGKRQYSDGFGPKPNGINHGDFNDFEALDKLRTERTCAVILEPIQGEGGVVPAHVRFLKEVRRRCSEVGALLIFDEVQTGVGRCGQMFAYEHFEVTPDIMTLAKGLGGGFPIGAMLTTEEIAKSLIVGSHASTFGGNALACAVAGEVVKIVSDPSFLNGVSKKGKQLRKGLEAIGTELGVFREVRGVGLLLGAELSARVQASPQDMIDKCFNAGVMVTAAGPQTIRLCPALNISSQEIDIGLDRLRRAFEDMIDTQGGL